ncbi:MAG: hypothetical protein WCP97_07175 [bacterium]
MINFSDLFDVYRLFQYSPPAQTQFFKPLLIAFFVLFVLAMAFRLFVIPRVARTYVKRFYNSIFLDLFLTSLIGVVLVFVRKAGYSFFSARIFLFLLVFHLAGKIAYYVFYQRHYIPAFESQFNAEQKRTQYLPKAKKKKKKR